MLLVNLFLFSCIILMKNTHAFQFSNIFEGVRKTAENIESNVQGAMQNIESDLKSAVKTIGTGIEAAADGIDSGVNALGQGIFDGVNPAIKELKKLDKKLLGGIDQTVFSVENGIVTGLDEVIGVPVELSDVQLFLIKNENEENPSKLDYFKPVHMASASGEIFFIIHGWLANSNATWMVDLTNVFLRKYPRAYVVRVDWSKPASNDYPFAAFNTESLGSILAVFINRLVTEYRIPLERFVLVGHSLGGQTSGWIGKKIKEITGRKLQRIIALDPAGPLFCLRPDDKRLNKHDAVVVMVIHSDAGKCGFLQSCGTVDFFPNGGAVQPGCNKITVTDLSTYLNPLSCDHLRSQEYFIEAVNNTGSFPSRKCSSFTNFRFSKNCEKIETTMGNIDQVHRGSFYLETASVSPYSIPLKP